MITTLLVDDQALVRGGLRMILEAQPDLAVVGEAADGAESIELVRALRPQVVLMDVRMPGVDGIEATRRILSQESGAPKILMLTTYDLDGYVYEALRAGASGFLLKNAPPADLVAAVRGCAAGDALLAPSLTRRLIEEYVQRPRIDNALPPELASLTDREREVLVAIARGMANREIAAALFLSEATVRTHVNRIFSKLQLRDRAQAVVRAYETGLVRPGDG